MSRPDLIDNAVASGTLHSLPPLFRMVGWVRGANIPVDDEMREHWDQALGRERGRREQERVEGLLASGKTASGQIRKTSVTTWKGMPCRGCGKPIEPSGKRGKPRAWHEGCR